QVALDDATQASEAGLNADTVPELQAASGLRKLLAQEHLGLGLLDQVFGAVGSEIPLQPRGVGRAAQAPTRECLELLLLFWGYCLQQFGGAWAAIFLRRHRWCSRFIDHFGKVFGANFSGSGGGHLGKRSPVPLVEFQDLLGPL